MVIHLLKLSLGIVSLALCVTLISLDINLGGEATLRVGNLRVPPSSTVKVQTQLTPNSTRGVKQRCACSLLSHTLGKSHTGGFAHMANAPPSSKLDFHGMHPGMPYHDVVLLNCYS